VSAWGPDGARLVIARCAVAGAKAGPYAHALFALPPRSRGNVELVSDEPLLNLGTFRIIVGDFERTWRAILQNGSAETKPNDENGP
jgi:hypothetical protein